MGRRANTIQDVLLRLVICEPTTMETGCWEWPGGLNDGYGRVRMNMAQLWVHRIVYEHFVGPIPEGLQIDHLCRNRKCANFEHLEPVTSGVNILRGAGPGLIAAINSSKTHCPKGHEYTEANTYRYSGKYNGRFCRICGVQRTREWLKRKKDGKG